MRIKTCTIRSTKTIEAYITATPRPGLPLEQQVHELFSGIRSTLNSQSLRLMQERVFGTRDALRAARSIRSQIYGSLDDGLEPSWLVVPEGINGQIAGVQVHAVGGYQQPQVLRLDDTPCGRIFRNGDGGYVTLSNISVLQQTEPVQQARLVFEKAESALKKVNADMLLVPRTWMWLDSILSWYDDFNLVRNKFFTERGLIDNGEFNKMPASTGIGIGPDNGSVCAMDLVAVLEPRLPIEYLNTSGKQNSALDYGSAFSRASKTSTPAGTTVFVSGTASIDSNGQTIYVDDARAQIETTIENIRAVLRQMNYNDDKVVQAIAYCKTVEVEKLFNEQWSELCWPVMTAIADVCRPELLFEMELTAATAN